MDNSLQMVITVGLGLFTALMMWSNASENAQKKTADKVRSLGPLALVAFGIVLSASGALGMGTILIASAGVWQIVKYAIAVGQPSRSDTAAMASTATATGMVVMVYWFSRLLNIVERMGGIDGKIIDAIERAQ